MGRFADAEAARDVGIYIAEAPDGLQIDTCGFPTFGFLKYHDSLILRRPWEDLYT